MPLERHDVYFQRRDIDFLLPLELHDVDHQRREVSYDCSLGRRDVTPNFATLNPLPLWNVATLPRTSRRCFVLNPIPFHFFCSYPKPALPEPKSSYTPSHTEPSPEYYHTGRRLVYCFPTFSVQTNVTITHPGHCHHHLHTTPHFLPALVLFSTIGLRVF